MRKTKLLSMLLSFLACLVLLAGIALAEETPPPPPVPDDLRDLVPKGTFLEEGAMPLFSETSYKSHDISVTITEVRDEESRSNVFVADIYVSSVNYLRRAFSHDKWKGPTRKMTTMAEENGAVVAITGDYASLLKVGLAVANGETYMKSQNNARENCLILLDGRMVTYPRREMVISEAQELGIWHSFLFGPSLIKDGEAVTEFVDKIRVANPRSVIGYYSPGHYCFVLVDGRSTKSRGMTLAQTSAFMKNLGCQTAYNLDGGQSAILWFNGEIVNKPYKGGRPLRDIVFVGPPKEE